MTKQKNNKIKETKKIYINHRFSDTDVDPNDRWVKQFQQTFSTSSSSRKGSNWLPNPDPP